MSRIADKLRAHKVAAGATLAAAAGAVALVFATSSAAVTAPLNVTDPNYPEGTTAIADASTDDTYTSYPTNDITTSFNTTQYVGRLWADKTVYAPTKDNVNLGTTATIDLASEERDLDGDPDSSRTTPGSFQVDKTESGTFLTEISLLSSSLTTELYEPVPLDIVLVLDTSTSMKQDAARIGYAHTFTDEQLANLQAGANINGNYIYNYLNPSVNNYEGKKAFEGYCEISKNSDMSDSQRVGYVNKHANNVNYLYIVTNDESLVGTRDNWYVHFINSDGNVRDGYCLFGYTSIYKQVERHNIDDLRDAVNDFIDAIAANNEALAAENYGQEYMSRISLVKFANGYNESTKFKINTNNIGGIDAQILTGLTTYTTSDRTGLDSAKSIVSQLAANGSTYADDGLTLAKAVLDGDAYVSDPNDPEPGARDDAKKVVIFFTDGNPKHSRGQSPTDFSGLWAKETLEVAESIKNEGVTIYSVAVLQGADPNDITMNANIYLNGVSSNYPKASATKGVDNPSVGFDYDEQTGEFNNLGPGPTDSNPQYLVYGTNYGNNSLALEYYTPSYLSWNPNLGAATNRPEDYTLTSDETVIRGKTYYERSGLGTASNPYVFTEVAKPKDADVGNYYEKLNYYLVASNGAIADAFTKVLNQITASGGDDTITTGRDGNTAVTITDYLGDYMEFKGVDGILYGTDASSTEFYAPGTQGAYHIQAQVQRDDRSATESVYMMSIMVPSALLFPEQGAETYNLNNITIKVTRSLDAKTGDTVTITVPPQLIPSIRYIVHQDHHAATATEEAGVTTTVRRTDVDPLRIFYSVGPKATTVSNVISQLDDQALRDPNAINESDKQTEAYRNFAADAAADGHDNDYPLYNNAIKPKIEDEMTAAEIAELTEQASLMGTTSVVLTVQGTNSFYFFAENEPLYINTAGANEEPNYVEATRGNYRDGATLYRLESYWRVGVADEVKSYVEWTGAYTVGDGDKFVIEAGTPKVLDGDFTNIERAKGAGNLTGTATNYLTTIFDGQTKDSTGENYIATFVLGNNGRLDIPVYGTLAVKKDFEAETGFDLPENATAEFTLTLKDSQGSSLSGDYQALIRDSQGHPVDPTTHSAVTSAESVGFTVHDGSTFTLRDLETLRVTGLPDGATYQVVETGQPGYKAKVTNNDSSVNDFDRGANSQTGETGTEAGGND